MNFVIVSEKKWNKDLAEFLNNKTNYNWILISKKEDFNIENLNIINPQRIFIPHWSYLIEPEIIQNFTCIVFHMTDLPFGRGGSPLQNLIVREFKKTKMTALKATDELDAGPVYLKKDLDLSGSAEEIYIRANNLIKEMILEILAEEIEPVEQQGEVTLFKRRTKEMSNIGELNEIEKIYDYIRMLDAEGYPNAYLDFNNMRIEFSNAQLNSKEMVTANVRIFKK